MANGKRWPRITVVTPSYNQGPFIEETIRSVLLQGYPNLEYIIIDGGSNDDSVEVIKRYERWLTYWVSEPDCGQAHALNKGFAHATGDIYAYLNSDDLYTPGCLQRVANDFAQGDAASWHAYPVVDFSEAGPVTLHLPPQVSRRVQAMGARGVPGHFGDSADAVWNAAIPWVLQDVSVHQPGVLWSRSLHEEVGGFDESLHYAFDRKFFMSLIARKHPLRVHHGDAVAMFRLHDASKTVLGGSAIRSPFVSDYEQIIKEFEGSLSLRERWALQKIKSEEVLSAIWSASTQNQQTDGYLLRLISMPLQFPATITCRFYWGTLRRFLLKSI